MLASLLRYFAETDETILGAEFVPQNQDDRRLLSRDSEQLLTKFS